MVDAGRHIVDLVVRDVEGARQHPGGALNAVAETDRGDADRVEVAGGHGHRVGVVDELRVRAQLVCVRGDLGVRLDGAQEPEDTARSDGVPNSLVDPIASGDLDVMTV